MHAGEPPSEGDGSDTDGEWEVWDDSSESDEEDFATVPAGSSGGGSQVVSRGVSQAVSQDQLARIDSLEKLKAAVDAGIDFVPAPALDQAALDALLARDADFGRQVNKNRGTFELSQMKAWAAAGGDDAAFLSTTLASVAALGEIKHGFGNVNYEYTNPDDDGFHVDGPSVAGAPTHRVVLHFEDATCTRSGLEFQCVVDKSIRYHVCAPAGMMIVMSRKLGCDRRIEHRHSAGVREDGVPLANVSLLFDVTLGPGSGAQVTVPAAELDFSGYKFSLENFRGKSHPFGGTGARSLRGARWWRSQAASGAHAAEAAAAAAADSLEDGVQMPEKKKKRKSAQTAVTKFFAPISVPQAEATAHVAILRDFFPPPTINLVSSDSEEQAEDEEGSEEAYEQAEDEEESEQAHEPLPSSSDEEEETSAVPPWAAAAGKTREQLDAEEHARQLAHTHFGQAVWYPQEPKDLTPFEFITYDYSVSMS